MSQQDMDATWSHGPVGGAINAGAAAVLVVMVGKTSALFGVGFPLWAPMLVAAVGVAASVVVGYRQHAPRNNIVFRGACWAGAGLWASYVLWRAAAAGGGFTAGWSWMSLVVLVGGCVLAALFAPVFAPFVEVKDAQPVEGRSFEAKLTRLIVRYGNLKHEVPTVEKICDWPGRTGHTWRVEGVEGSDLSWRTLRDMQISLAVGLQLPDGCPVQADKGGGHQGAALLHIATVNNMAEVLPYPLDFSELSLKDEFSIGRFMDQTPTMVELYQAAGLIGGQRGGGKTMLLHNITASLVRMRDVIVWHIDLNGGSVAGPWTTPFARGEVGVPAVDWIATDADEALRMATVALAIAMDRKSRYQSRLIDADTDVLNIDAGLPAIIIIVDEAAEVTGDAAVEAAKVAAALQKLQRVGRAVCIHVLFAVQRATADYLPAQVKRGTSLAICFRVQDDAELAHVFGWRTGINCDDLIYNGQAFIKRASGAVRLFKGFFLPPSVMIQIVHAVQHIRPRLDEPARRIGGTIYAERWQRPKTMAYLATLRGDRVAATAVAESPDTVVDLSGLGVGVAPSLSSAADAIEKLRRSVQQAKETAARAATPKPPAGPDEDLASLEALWNLTPHDPRAAEPPTPPPAAVGPDMTPAPEPSQQDRENFILDLLARAGATGMKTAEIVAAVLDAGYTRRDTTPKDDLTRMKRDGRVGQRSDAYGRWFHVDYAA